MVTVVSVEHTVRMRRFVPNGVANLCSFLPVHLFKIISAMIMTPPTAKPSPGTKYTEKKRNIKFDIKL